MRRVAGVLVAVGALVVTLAAPATVSADSLKCTIVGTAGDDAVTTVLAGEVFCGGDGDDTVLSNLGTFIGGEGNDTVANNYGTFLGGSGDAAVAAPAPDGATAAQDEAERERALLREDAQRLSDDLLARQLRYADRSWTPPAQGGSQRADGPADADEGE